MLCMMLNYTCCTNSISLNKIKENIDIEEFYVRSSLFPVQLIEKIKQNLSGKTSPKGDLQIEEAAKMISKNPCLLTKIASNLDVSSMRLMISNKFIGLSEDLQSCKGLLGRPIKTSVTLIEGEENDFNNLRMNVLQFVDRDIRCFVIVCSEVCSSLILHIVETIGFGIDIYFWIAVLPFTIRNDLHHLKNFVSLAHVGKSLNDIDGCHFANGSRNSGMWKNEKALFEVVSVSNLFDANPTFAERKLLKVAMVKWQTSESRPDLLDYTNMDCQHGMLCWLYPFKNGSFTKKREATCCLGFVMDILLLLQRDMHVDFYLYEVEDGLWGVEENGTWKGLIGEVAARKADIAADWLSITEARLSVVDFTEPSYIDENVLAARFESKQLSYLNFVTFNTFSRTAWILMLCFTLMAGVVIYATERLIFLPSDVQTGCNVLAYVVGLIYQRDIGGHVPKNLGSRFVSLTLAITLMVIVSTYTAAKTSESLSDIKTPPLSGMNDPKVTQPTPKFRIGTYKGSIQSQMFVKSRKVTWRRLGAFMKPYNFLSLTDGYKQLQQGVLHAIISDRLSLALEWKKDHYCDIQIVESINKQSLGFALPKGSMWKEAISSLLHKYKNRGIVEDLGRKYFASHCKEKTASHPHQFGIPNLSANCILLAIGILLSLCFLISEYVFNICVKKFERSKTYTLSAGFELQDAEGEREIVVM